MTTETQTETYAIHLKRVFAAPREKVFRAWTNPEELKKWWAVEDDWTTPIAEVDLRVGGAYRLGMQSPNSEAPYVVVGTYREVKPPEKLVYTWRWEGEDTEETLVTVEFQDQGGMTEVTLKHEYFSEEKARDDHNKGWNGCLDHLAKTL